MPDSTRAHQIGPHDTLLHVGPHKTGTTAVQGALHGCRDALQQQGVSVPGDKPLHDDAGRVVTEFASTTGLALPPASTWPNLVELVRATPGRSAICSEFFDVAVGKHAQRIVDDLGRDRLHIVITAVPLESLFPSNWQQRVRGRAAATFDSWLTQTFNDLDAAKETIFWRRQRTDAHVQRWIDLVGVDRVHLVIGDKNQPRQLFDSFEDLLGVTRGTLQPHANKQNRSLTWPEAEFLRRINELAKERKWSGPTHARFARMGAAHGILDGRPADPSEPRITVPRWARERLHTLATEMVANLEASGIHIAGDPATLIPNLDADVSEPEPVTSIGLELAAQAVMGTAEAGGAGILREKSMTRRMLKDYPGVSSAPTDLLLAEIKKRARAKVNRTLRRG